MIGILFCNLGTPDAPTPSAVRRYLREFLGDPRVVELPRLFWLPLLNGVILPIRGSKSAHAYQQVWTEQGSPLLVQSRGQADALQAAFDASHPCKVKVALGMTYGKPSLASALGELRSAGIERVLVMPLYPQYSSTTTAAIFDGVARALRKERVIPELRFINHYHADVGYIAALATSVREYWSHNGMPDKLLMSFHGIPKRNADRGDLYPKHCSNTAKLLADALELPNERWVLSFQSRFGKAEWLQPYTDKTLMQLGSSGVGRVDVVCPGFPADCLETLEEIAVENRDFFLASGGRDYRYIPALNTQTAHINFLHTLCLRHMGGWAANEGY